MQCNKCGIEIGNSRFCGSCGQDQLRNSGNCRQPDFERKTVECYPSTLRENETIEFYGRLGWSMVSSQRNQEYTGQSSDGTKHFSTCTRIMFERDKNISNFTEIKRLSDIAEENWNATPKIKRLGFYVFGLIASLLMILACIIMPIMIKDSLITSATKPAMLIALVPLTLSLLNLIYHGIKSKKNFRIIYDAKMASLAAADQCEKLIKKTH